MTPYEPPPWEQPQQPLPSPYDEPTHRLQHTPSAPPKSANGMLILLMGVFSMLCCNILGPVTWIVANNALVAIDSGRANASERDHVNAGRIMGMISTAFIALGCVAFGVMFIIALIQAILSPPPSTGTTPSIP